MKHKNKTDFLESNIRRVMTVIKCDENTITKLFFAITLLNVLSILVILYLCDYE